MGEFRHQLQREFMARMARNPAYSLRAFARQLNISHATLSSMLSGRRKITKATVDRLGNAIGLSPATLKMYAGQPDSNSYVRIEEDVFASLSTWYLDAISELTRIRGFKMESKNIARALGISVVEATAAFETLQRLGLIEKAGGKFRLRHGSTTTVLGAEQTTAAQKTLQKAILQKSIEAVDSIPRPKRNHSSIAMAIDTRDFPKIKEMIATFRRELDRFAQRPDASADQVYQLQVSFFPLSQIEGDGND